MITTLLLAAILTGESADKPATECINDVEIFTKKDIKELPTMPEVGKLVMDSHNFCKKKYNPYSCASRIWLVKFSRTTNHKSVIVDCTNKTKETGPR